MLLLGADVSLTQNRVCADARHEQVARLKGRISQAMSLDFVNPDSASTLRAQIDFRTSPLAGKIGRGMMWPLVKRQYIRRYS